MAEQNNEVKVPGYLKVSKVLVWLLYLWVLFGIIMLLLRVFLLAASANLSAGFAQFVMETSNRYLEPFRGIFSMKPVGETGYLDVSALFAIIVYLFIAWGFHALITYVQNKIELSRMEQEKRIAQEQAYQRQPAVREQTTVSRTTKTTTAPRRPAPKV